MLLVTYIDGRYPLGPDLTHIAESLSACLHDATLALVAVTYPGLANQHEPF